MASTDYSETNIFNRSLALESGDDGEEDELLLENDSAVEKLILPKTKPSPTNYSEPTE